MLFRLDGYIVIRYVSIYWVFEYSVKVDKEGGKEKERNVHIWRKYIKIPKITNSNQIYEDIIIINTYIYTIIQRFVRDSMQRHTLSVSALLCQEVRQHQRTSKKIKVRLSNRNWCYLLFIVNTQYNNIVSW